MPKLPDDPQLIVNTMGLLVGDDGSRELAELVAVSEPVLELSENDWGQSYYSLVLNVPAPKVAGITARIDKVERALTELAKLATRGCTNETIS